MNPPNNTITFSTGWFSIYFYCVTIKTIYLYTTRTLWKFAMRCSTNFNALSNVANALGNVENVANAFENNNSALESVANGLKYVATHFQCIFQRVFNAFSTYLLCRVFANRVTYYLRCFYADKVSCNANKATWSKTKKLTLSLAAMKFCNSVLGAAPAVPTQMFFRLRINTFLVRKILLLFHQKTALCCMLIFFHVTLK